MSEIIITHNGVFNLSTGRHRNETSWKNKEWQWSDFVKKLSTTHRTAETYAEYLSLKKDRQDEIKDIGGFVGGLLSGGRRKKYNVAHRQLITLDVDYAHPDLWADFTMLYGAAALVYSTHKHTKEQPRLRLVMPLDRPVFADEYVAISRRIAGVLGIEFFDHTTFEPERLMYWPSTAKDADYMFEFQDGAWLSADEVLATYHDWRDSSEWPISERYNGQITRAMKKQGDPLEKPGVIGAWCRTYSIEQVLELFLSDVYEPCAVEGRYTYKEGSTAGGLVLYDDKYAFSHHGTDPVSGKLCNAFDLVRLHLFGLKDEDVKEGTPGNKLPSYTEMVNYATKDSKVRMLLGAERLSEARQDFDGVVEEEGEAENTDWLAELEVDRKGNYYGTINNIITIIKNDPMLKGRIAFNQFEQREVALKNLPWRKLTSDTNSKYLTDKDDAGVRHYLENTYEISNNSKTKDAMDIALLSSAFHPVRDYLNSCSWDGEKRLDSLLIDYLGAEDSDYTRAVTRKTLVAAVARVFKPGIKFDYVLTLVGKQGIGKSSIIKKLGRDWYSDSFGTIQGKEAFEQIQGVWLVEMGELAGLKKAELETIKHYISKQEDRYRVAYGRRIENFPRQCIFFGTSNDRGFLRDPTGNRRFWPVDTLEIEPSKNVFVDLTDFEIDQIWAEAVEAFKKGEPLYLSKELEEKAYAMQAEHVEVDERAGLIQKYLGLLFPENWDTMNIYDKRSYIRGEGIQEEGTIPKERVCAAEIWCEVLGGLDKDMNRFNTKEIHNIMRGIEGWEPAKSRKKFKGYGLQICYEKTSKKVTSKQNFDVTSNKN